MKLLSPVLYEALSASAERGALLMFHCPGCECGHLIQVNKPPGNKQASWDWDGNAEAPTFSPSIFVDPHGEAKCHSFVRNGQIEFLPDSHHALAGQTVPLPAFCCVASG